MYPAPLPHLGLMFSSGAASPAPLPHMGLLGGATSVVSVNGAAPFPHLALLGGLGLSSLSLSAAAGSYTLSGQDATLTTNAGRLLFAETGQYSVLGSGALRDFEHDVAAGAYTVTGFDVQFLRGTVMPAEGGTYSLSGQEVGWLFGGDRILPALHGTYALTGQAALAARTRVFPAQTGIYSSVGWATTTSKTLSAESGAYFLAGFEVASTKLRTLRAEPGAYAIRGFSAVLFTTEDLDSIWTPIPDGNEVWTVIS